LIEEERNDAPDEGQDQGPEPEEMTPEDAAGYEEEAAQADVPAPEASGETPPPGVEDGLSEEQAETLEPNALEVERENREELADTLEEAAEEAGRPRGKASERGERDVKEPKREVIPGEHLEPILPEQQPAASDDEFGYAASAYAEPEPVEAEAVAEAEAEEAPAEPAPAPRTPKELAADARYQATGKRKTSVARVIIKPGTGEYKVNGRALEDFFPRTTLQKSVRAPLETAGYEERMDVIARIHGGGVSAQAGALRHGVARALVEADPNLRGELKRRGFLTRDARAKERKKAGLKKARKRPQFSKR
jgi:small subunit ribosomal protein S9